MRKSKPCSHRVPLYEHNPDRRIHCPERSLHKEHYENLCAVAKKYDMSKSRVFETIMQNFFLVEKPTIHIDEVIDIDTEKMTLKKLTLHPSIIELIRAFSISSKMNSSRYINSALDIYFNKHHGEMELKKVMGL